MNAEEKKILRDKTTKRTHVNFRRKNSSYFKFFFIFVILLHSEPLPDQVSQNMVPNPGTSNSNVFYIVPTKVSMPVVEEEIVTFKRQRVGNKLYLHHIVTDTLDQIQNASTAQENSIFKVMALRDVIIDKLKLIKSYDILLLRTI